MSWVYHGDVISRDDMQAKFRETYVKLQKHGLCFVRSFERDVAFVFTVGGREELAIPSNEFVVTQEFPKVGVMANYRKQAYKISRVPVRQWRIGLMRTTLRLTQGEQEFPLANLNNDLVKALFDPSYVDLAKAFGMVCDDHACSVAISPYYWLRYRNSQVELLRRDILVGGIDIADDGKTFNVKLLDVSGPFAQEIEDEFKDGKYKVIASV